MPTRLNQTTITLSDSIKEQLEQYDKESWDEFFERMLILIRRDSEED